MLEIPINTSSSSSSSSSLCHATSTDLPGPLSSLVSIVHCFRQVFQATSCIETELLYIGSSWSSYLCSSMWRGLQEYIASEFALTSLAVSCMFGLSNFDSFRDRWSVTVQLLLCGTCTILLEAFLCNWTVHK